MLDMTLTPGQRAVVYYLQLREHERRGGASYAEMGDETGLGDRTLERAVPGLIAKGAVHASAE